MNAFTSKVSLALNGFSPEDAANLRSWVVDIRAEVLSQGMKNLGSDGRLTASARGELEKCDALLAGMESLGI